MNYTAVLKIVLVFYRGLFLSITSISWWESSKTLFVIFFIFVFVFGLFKFANVECILASHICVVFTMSQNCVCSGVKPVYVTLIGNIIVGMLLVLPTDPSAQGPGAIKGPSLQEQGALVFKAILYGTSELCMPYISISSPQKASRENESRQKNRLAAVQLLGALIGIYSSLLFLPSSFSLLRLFYCTLFLFFILFLLPLTPLHFWFFHFFKWQFSISSALILKWILLFYHEAFKNIRCPNKTEFILIIIAVLVFFHKSHWPTKISVRIYVPHSRITYSSILNVKLFLTIGTQSKNSPISVDEGWTWIVRLSNQLEEIGKTNGGHNGPATTHYQECCISLLLFLRQGSAAFIARFGWTTTVAFFSALRAALSSVSNAEGGAAFQLINWLDSAIKSHGAKCTIDLRHHEPHVMASYLVIRWDQRSQFTWRSVVLVLLRSDFVSNIISIWSLLLCRAVLYSTAEDGTASHQWLRYESHDIWQRNNCRT